MPVHTCRWPEESQLQAKAVMPSPAAAADEPSAAIAASRAISIAAFPAATVIRHV